MLIDFNLYPNHPYYKKISDYFDHIELINSLSGYYDFNIHDINLNHQLVRETEFNVTQEQMVNLVDSQMRNLIILITYSLMKKHGFDYRDSVVKIDKETNKIKASLMKWNHLDSFVKIIEKTIDGESVVFEHEVSVTEYDSEYTDLCERRSVTLFEIDFDDLSFEEIDNQLEKYAKIKDQLISELQNM